MVLIIVVAGIVSDKVFDKYPENVRRPDIFLQAMNVFFFYLVTWRHLVAGACLGFLGYTFGATAATLARMGRPQVVT